MVAKKLLILTALVETATGVMLLVSPTRVVAVLLGASLDAPAALVVARMAGAAVLSLGCACWLARGATASMVAARLDLAHHAVCHRCARELLAGRTNRRVLTTGLRPSASIDASRSGRPDHTARLERAAASAASGGQIRMSLSDRRSS